MIDRRNLKNNAREAIRQMRPHPVWVTLVVMGILFVTQMLSLSLNGDLDACRIMMENAMNGEFVYVQSSGTSGMFPWLLALALDLMSMVVSMGYTLYSMRVSRRENPGFGDVFDAFARFFRVVILSLMRSILLSILSAIYAFPAAMLSLVIDPVVAAAVCLPLFAPMILASYAWRLSEYILFDNPSYTGIQCLALSRMCMRGRKWELFKLDLSFIGWWLLSLVPFVILWVRPYHSVTTAEYYDAVLPSFWEEMKNRPQSQEPNVRSPGGWHIPGENGDGDDLNDTDDF